MLTTLATCGDVNRNVMCNPNPHQSDIHARGLPVVAAIGRATSCRRPRAYREIWIDRKKVAGDAQDEEPLYGPTYLPRKFKIGMAVPPSNDVDVFTHDLGLVAIVADGRLAGFDVLVGGGMGTTHGEPATYPAACLRHRLLPARTGRRRWPRPC